ncbi:MAG: cobyric acid synthase [Firmicutes bacterium]|nr:cobyric acid synthase [Bacillota bacterium]
MKGKLMIQGTASSVGKSLLCAALCRILRQDGYSVAPFKSQNMALNSFVTREGYEMGRAQVMQAEASGIEPRVEMNPVLLKPTSDRGSQVVVMGRPVGNMEAMAYFDWKDKLLPVIDKAYKRLASDHDIIIIEGAGSPAEINLKERDLVNMGLALRVKAPVLLAGDIDRGGVFASLYGTAALLSSEERSLLKGVIINKFRGDIKVLEPGLKQLEELIKLPVLGVVPMISLNLDDEDSVTERFSNRTDGRDLKVRVVLLPRISNFTDFNPFELFEDVDLSYIRKPSELDSPDLLILPGSKNTIEDLLYLRQMGWQEPLRDYVNRGGLLAGICGGFQMLGQKLSDPGGVESSQAEVPGFGFLEMETVMESEKSTFQVEATWRYRDDNYFAGMSGEEKLTGYEIHMGKTVFHKAGHPVYVQSTGQWEGAVNSEGNVFGTYMHGIFDNLAWTGKLLNTLRRRRGLSEKNETLPAHYREYKEKEYDKLAGVVRESLDIEQVYKIIAAGV